MPSFSLFVTLAPNRSFTLARARISFAGWLPTPLFSLGCSKQRLKRFMSYPIFDNLHANGVAQAERYFAQRHGLMVL